VTTATDGIGPGTDLETDTNVNVLSTIDPSLQTAMSGSTFFFFRDLDSIYGEDGKNFNIVNVVSMT
jgi:hypothetical protein